MLNSTKQHIVDVLVNDEEYQRVTSQIEEVLPHKLAADGVDDENMNLLIKLENLIMEVAYLKGYADGLEESTIKKVKEEPGKYLSINEVYNLTDEMGITGQIEKPAR
ncbi:hypothetical protein [Halothermothrix orenii]|uniref:Uncharacterized protein n=1 Tax=Halothermothrix orenii (strain H 168 / OCM 544 / DSM 9562) TaxID=373903 RepID=B8D1P5_HALOH|nr:hypothetical protein [Halothermothrix orenii]ACL69122.1 hypothetical protein Hore_03610 [Halothermothrix orenii H 168]